MSSLSPYVQVYLPSTFAAPREVPLEVDALPSPEDVHARYRAAYAEAVAVMRVFRLRHYVGPIVRMRARFHPFDDEFSIRVMSRVAARDDGQPLSVEFKVTFRADHPRAEVLFMLHEALTRATLHELHECVYVGDDRVFDPHVPEKQLG